MNPENNLLTLFHTVRHLKTVQISHRIYRARFRESLSAVPGRRLAPGKWTSAIAREPAQTGPMRFRFLNEEREPRGWDDENIPKLWLYNLHYFDSPELELMLQWVRENPPGCGNGWEPYPLSRRIVNWIKWQQAGGVLVQECLESLAAQAECLSNSVEYHLLGNHLFANAKALVFAGLFFCGRQADKWLQQGLRILGEQLPEQVLSDGGHFERSPMYHSMILEDLLDLVNAAQAYPQASLHDHVPGWKEAAARMLGWLESMCHPDGRISFFNDAAFGIAPEPGNLFDYAERVAIRGKMTELGESGYVRLENERTVVLFDAAPIGPDYQPGHGHADALSFEVSHHGRRVVVNSGTSTYEVGPERTRQRGTPAHNAVAIDGADQSEVWASFRVGRRARVFDVKTDHATFVGASHDGYRHLKGRVVHRRRVELTKRGLLITDTLEGAGAHDVTIYFHIHPDAQADIQLDRKFTRRVVEEGTWHPEFNVSVPNRRIRGHFRGVVPVTFQSLLALA